MKNQKKFTIRTLRFAVAASALSASQSIAQEECTSIANDSERLECYDIANGKMADETEIAGIGKWTKRVDTSPLTDEKSVFLSLFSDNNLRARFGSPGPATIYLRCSENTTSAFFIFNGHFMSDIQSYGRIEYRIDQETMRTINTSSSTDNEALGLWRGNSSIPFIKRLLGADSLIVRATPYNESPMTATFDIRGIDDAVSELRETCNW